MITRHTPPDAILRASTGFFAGEVTWNRLVGGRTNLGWRGQDDVRDLVFKLYDSDRSNSVFPNDPAAEWAALGLFYSAGLSPHPVEMIETSGQSCLVYEYVHGTRHETATPEMARALGAVHAHALPESFVGDGAGSAGLIPGVPTLEYGRDLRFLHGDPTPANALATAQGVCFLDWQCPRLGDPVDDLAVLVSPAMHVVYGGRVLSANERRDVLAAYPDPNVVARYEALALPLSNALAAYCVWKVSEGEDVYAEALAAERAYIAELSES